MITPSHDPADRSPSARSDVPASPEEALGRTGEKWRDWAPDVLVAPVRVALLRAELGRDPGAVRREERGEPLYQAVRGLGTDAVTRGLVEELAGSGDAVLEGEAIRLARAGLHAGALTPGVARTVLTGLLHSRTPGVVTGALAELAEPWAALEPIPASATAALLGPGTAEAALTTAARHSHGALLRWTAEDRAAAPRVRRRALELLGETAVRDDVPGVLALAAEDPLLLGGPAVACLRAMHRRGHFVTDADVPAVLGLALADHTIPARAVATVLYTSRREVLRLLLEAVPDARDWPRRLDLLVALGAQGVDDVPIAAEIARVLPLAPTPTPFLRTLRALRAPDTEPAVLAALPHAPAAALEALEAVGGERTVRALARGLGIDRPGEDEPSTAGGTDDGPAWSHIAAGGGEADAGGIVPALRAVREQALEVLWLLTTDPVLRRRILVRLDPVGLPARVVADLGGPDEHELAVLASHLDPDRPVDALCRLAAHGGPASLPVLADLLLRLAGDLAASWEPGGTGPVPEAEPAIPPDVVDALDDLGRRLYARRRIRPVCLLDAEDARSAGHALVADLALGLLDRPGLSAGEQAVLLKLLRDLPYAPHAHVRSRVHRLLRHPDRHVRKHVVALLARDTAGDGVEALSAGLLALTGPARDAQTVRQTLAALGRARAHWASDAIAGCLGHPNMNVRKTAAEALATAGTPQAVPALLHRLGRDDNPGLRALVVQALRSLLGEAYAATVTAAAEREGDARVRDRLRAALGAAPKSEDDDITRLTERGWDPVLALRVAERGPESTSWGRQPELRPYLVDWLALAATSADARRAVLPLLPRVCPAPWERHERAAFARGVPVLLDGLAEAAGDARDRLIELLDAAAPLLRPAVAAEVVTAVRALPPRAAGRLSTLPLLRACGAVVVRADLDRELAAAGLAENPDTARARLLREVFGVGDPQPYEASTWHAELKSAVGSTESVAAFRAASAPAHRPDAPGSRARLAALVDAQTDASPGVRAALLDWMTDLQPLGAPSWTLAEAARARVPATREVRDGDLDQPRSAAQRDRLLTMLASDTPDHRDKAARILLTWPEPAPRRAVLDAYLRGAVELPPHDLREALAESAPTLLAESDSAARTSCGSVPLPEAGPAARAEAGRAPAADTGLTPAADDGPATPSEGGLSAPFGGAAWVRRFGRVAASLGARDAEVLVPLLLRLWEDGPADARADLGQALRNVSGDVLVAQLAEPIAAGLLPLLSGRRLLRTAALVRLHEQHPDAGIVLVDGPLRGPDATDQDAAALRALRERAKSMPPPSRQELYRLARSRDPERIRRALTLLAEDAGDGPHPELADLLRGLLTHPHTGIRLHAHRTSRALLDRETHLRLTEVLLDDPQPDVVRGAVRVLAHARWQPAVPALTSLLDHAHPTVRRAAEDGLVRVGPAAVPALRRTVSRARPDRRARYADVLARVTAAGDEE